MFYDCIHHACLASVRTEQPTSYYGQLSLLLLLMVSERCFVVLSIMLYYEHFANLDLPQTDLYNMCQGSIRKVRTI